MIALNLTEQEAATLRALIDLAVKTGGMQVAQVAIGLDQKIQQAISVGAATVPFASDKNKQAA